jgi:hypothetical protein
MDKIIRESIWNQFGAAIDMFENALLMCPDELWNSKCNFWYIAFDCLYYLDYYLTLDPATYKLPEPFAFAGPDPNDGPPERVYTREELLTWLSSSRNKCRDLIASMTTEIATGTWSNLSKTMSYPVMELLIYNMRHLQHHTGQLNLLLRQNIDDAPDWISRAGTALENN